MNGASTGKALLKRVLATAFHQGGITKRWQQKASPTWRVLMYHRVVDPESEGYPLQPGMYVRPRTFGLQMRYLADACNVVRLDELAAALAIGNALPPRTVAITFDDGWRDNYTNALPILKQYKLPATIFLATSFIGTSRLFWTDEVAMALSALGREKVHANTITARIAENEDIDLSFLPLIDTILSEKRSRNATGAMDELILLLKKQPAKRRQLRNALMKLAQEYTKLAPERRFLDWDEIKLMAESNIAFGSHTHNHHNLTELNSNQINDEVNNSLQLIRAHGIDPATVFCYPEGGYNAETQQALAAQKIRFALMIQRQSKLQSSPALLGRIGIHDDISRTIPLFVCRIWGERLF